MNPIGRYIFVLFAGCLFAQNGAQFSEWKAAPGNRLPKAGCSALRSLSGYEFTVATAELVPATDGVPEHCRVSGLVQPEVRFVVTLPSVWNGRLYMSGNGGFAGEPLDAPARDRTRAVALRSGFATADTNTGHDARIEPQGSFASNPQKLLDYAFRAVHVTAETAKKLAQAYYGALPARAYFDGCSTGGRQGLIAAQRFPADFDGIVVGAPVLNFTGTMLSYTWINQVLLSAGLREEQLRTLADRVYASCDEKDGLKDGIIGDPRKCDFQPERDLPKCSGDRTGADCFTAQQIAAIQRMHTDVTAGGKRLFPGFPVGAEAIAGNRSGLLNWFIRNDGATLSTGFASSFLRDVALSGSKESIDWKTFDFEKDPARLGTMHAILDATDTDLSAFRVHGGKILMYYGWADPALNPLMGVEYYEQMREKMGAGTTDFFRLFMVPGMFHCRGGVGPDAFDAMTPLVNWVEKGTKPEVLKAKQTNRSRPLCPYPQVARYSGSGSVDDAASFRCVAP